MTLDLGRLPSNLCHAYLSQKESIYDVHFSASELCDVSIGEKAWAERLLDLFIITLLLPYYHTGYATLSFLHNHLGVIWSVSLNAQLH